MRVSSCTSPSGLSGTLKSTRMKTRFPCKGRSRMDSFGMMETPLEHESTRKHTESFRVLPCASVFLFFLQTLRNEELDEIAHTAGVSPLVVVPRDHLDAVSADHAGHIGINDGGTLVALEIAGDQRLIG